MTLTVKDIMDLDIMRSATVRSGQDILDERKVQCVSVIEIPVEDFVREHEFVLSTTIGCGHDERLLMEFVRDVYEANAAALVISTGRYIFDIPPNVLDFAEANQFPIIDVPWDVRFADISEAVLTALSSRNDKPFKRSNDLQQQMFNLILQGKHLSHIAELVYKEIKLPVLISNHRGTVYGKSKHSDHLVDVWNGYGASSPNSLQCTSVQSTYSFSQGERRILHLDQQNVLQTAIRSTGNILGYLLVHIPSNTSVDTFPDHHIAEVLEYAVIASALWFSKENAIIETEMRLRDDFVWSLCRENNSVWEDVLSRAKSLGYNVSVPYVCILGCLENLQHLHKKHGEKQIPYEHWVHNIVRYIEEQIIHAGKVANRETMTTYQQNKFVVFLEVSRDSVEVIADRFLDLVDSQIRSLLPEAIMSWGIGNNRAGVHMFADSFKDAGINLDIGRRQRGPGYRTTYAETSMYRALVSLVNNAELKEIVAATIGELITYDQKSGMDLMNTFRVYVRNHGNVSRTARSLNLHRQSLLYRMRKIESLTNRSLFDSDDLFLIDLSIKLWTMGINQEQQS